jgi:predicted permease
MGTTRNDIRFGFRTLVRSPGFTAVSVLTLGLGIGANAAIFSVLDAVLLRGLPFREPDRLVALYEARANRGWTQVSFTYANFWDVHDQARTFEAIGAYAGGSINLTGFEFPERLPAGYVSAEFFRALGVDPIVGRTFGPGEDDPGATDRIAVVSHRFWTARLSSDRAAVGQRLTLNGEKYTIIGVLPRGEPWLDAADVFMPLIRQPNADRSSFELSVIGRVKPGVSLEAARSDLTAVAHGLAERFPETNRDMGVTVQPSSAWIAGDDVRRGLWILMGAVGFLLLIACVNLANLFLAKATGRVRERALRAALGATKARIVRQALTESLLVSLLGAMVGLGMATAVLGVLRGIEADIPRLAEVGVNLWVLGFTVVVTLVTGVLTGISPAVQAAQGELASVLRDGERTAGSGRGMGRLRGTLVAVEVAASLALLVGAGLLLRSFAQVMSVDRGFETNGRVLAEVALPGSYDGPRSTQFIEAFIARVGQLPDVVTVAAASQRPLVGVGVGMGFVAADRPEPNERDIPWASWRIVTADYFKALGVRLQRGRDFTPADLLGKPWRVIVSRRIAERLWPGEDAIGRTLVMWKGQGDTPAEVIGVSGDMRDWSLTEEPAMTVYFPYYGAGSSPIHFVIHSSAAPGTLLPRLREVLAELDPNLPLSRVQGLDQRVGESVSARRLMMLLLAAFAGVALVMSLAGIYGVLSYAVSRRTSEIGVRLAMGASHRAVLGLIVRQGMGPVLVGLAVGLIASLSLARLMAALLFEIRPTDPVTYLAVAAVLGGAALLACYLPARQALGVDVVSALRKE